MGPGEQFSHALGKVPQLSQRLECFKFSTDFEPRKIDLKPDIQTLGQCSTLFETDKRIKSILEVILHIGNFLNNGNRRLGSALGFSFDTLAKLHDTKTTDNKRTIFEVIVEMLLDQSPSLLEFSKEELDLVSEGARVSLETMQGEMKRLLSEFKKVQELVPSVQAVDEEDTFGGKMTAFIEKARLDCDQMETDFNEAVSSFNKLVELYGEDPAKMSPEDFFGVWKTFTSKLVETATKIKADREKAEKLRAREEAKKKREAAKKKPAAKKAAGSDVAGAKQDGEEEDGEDGGDDDKKTAKRGGRGRGRGRGGRGRGGRGRGGAGGDQGQVDALFEKMQAGNVFADRRQ